MKIQVWMVGKTSQDFVNRGLTEYEGRISHYLPFEIQIIPGIKNAKHLSHEQIKEKEGEENLNLIETWDYIVLLDEHGQEFTSVEFSEYLEKKMQLVPKSLVFVIGGAYGFSPEVLEAAQEKIALSKMTFSHQLVRLVFAEQLYRALTILKREPYHHETIS
ncbi:MAG: 23S rRNA (pseudouridine(1915)-N(3))-methyltransferase RlmH [Dysgonamonadaceae bacterium]|jgi:23S rRNA (pseudouridine1915-N3)-methyltransferase|nr:23S rRNA (pseudouridine(1915)-N(3))-methyltransferase RlmH [Dysgonamonadaceae bacterium]